MVKIFYAPFDTFHLTKFTSLTLFVKDNLQLAHFYNNAMKTNFYQFSEKTVYCSTLKLVKIKKEMFQQFT